MDGGYNWESLLLGEWVGLNDATEVSTVLLARVGEEEADKDGDV